jgi:hypothetical protein
MFLSAKICGIQFAFICGKCLSASSAGNVFIGVNLLFKLRSPAGNVFI